MRSLDHDSGSTTLSTHVKSLRRQKIPYDITWEFKEHASPFNPSTWWCRLCTLERYYILFEPGEATLNQRSEFFSHCFHQKPQLLAKKNWNLQDQNLHHLHLNIYLFILFIYFSFPYFSCILSCDLIFICTPFCSCSSDECLLDTKQFCKVLPQGSHVLLMR